MRILFLGNFRVDYCSEVHYSKTLAKMGHKVIQLQESEATGSHIIAECRLHKPDYFFWVHTHGWNTPGIDDALSYMKACGITTFGYHLDLYTGLDRKPQMHDYVTKMNHFFTVDKLMADWLNEDPNSTTRGHYLPAGVFEDECYLAKPDYKRFPHEVVFTGAKGYHPEYPYRPQLIDWLHKTYGERFAHYGGGGRPVQRGADLNTLYASARVVVGDTLCIGFNYPYYFSDRLFEVPGRGGFMVFPFIKGVELMYNIPFELCTYTYGDFAELKHIIDMAIEDNGTRESVRDAGHKRVKESHTYTLRLKTILEILENERNTSSKVANTSVS